MLAIILGLILWGVFALVQWEREREKKKARDRRSETRGLEKRRAAELRMRIKKGTYDTNKDGGAFSSELSVTTQKEKLQAWVANRPLLGGFVSEPRVLWHDQPSITSDFDRLNFTQVGARSEGQHDLFPYFYMDFGHSGIRWISTTATNDDSPGKLYLVSHRSLKALKVGITSHANPHQRVSDHRREGWQVLGEWNLSSGRVARSIEHSVIRWWRDDLRAQLTLRFFARVSNATDAMMSFSARRDGHEQGTGGSSNMPAG